jgi:cytoskeletal protein RodZ
MNSLKQLLNKGESKGSELMKFISKHRVVIVILVASSAIILAVFQTQSYLNPERNEDKYTEVKSSLTIKQLDEEVIDKLETTQLDQENTASSSFVEDRTNPFTE